MKNNKPNNKDSIPATKKRKNSRTKGLQAERKYARIFREKFGFEKCRTTRSSSRLLDDCKIDLDFIPLAVQIKKGYADRRPRADEIFKDMKKSLCDNFPVDDPVHLKPRVLIHEIDATCEENCLVTMTFNDWSKFFMAYEEVKKRGGRNV